MKIFLFYVIGILPLIFGGCELNYSCQGDIVPLSGEFSVSSTQTVTFSPGNLQYHPMKKKWRFAEKQTDYIGYANSNISTTYNGWIDLFAVVLQPNRSIQPLYVVDILLLA